MGLTMESWIHKVGVNRKYKTAIRRYVTNHGFDMVLLSLADVAHEIAAKSTGKTADAWTDFEIKLVELVDEVFGPPAGGGGTIRKGGLR